MSYLLEQLQAYQEQLRELEVNRQWQHSGADRARLPPIQGASGSQIEGGESSGVEGVGGRYPGAEAHEMMAPVYAEQAIMSVNGPVRHLCLPLHISS